MEGSESAESFVNDEARELGVVMTSYSIAHELVMERRRQDKKWGVQNHLPERWLTILLEEVGEAAHGRLENDRANYREELVQSAAVIVAMIESLDRGNW